MYFKIFIYHELSVYPIESVFKVNFHNYVFFGLGLSIKQQKTYEAISAQLWCLHLIVAFHILLDVIRRHSIWHILRKVLPTAIGRSPPSGFFSESSFAPKKYGRSSKGTFPSRITFTRLLKALRKFNPVCAINLAVKSFKIWVEMPTNLALEPLGKDMRALWTKNSEVEKQSISVGSGKEQVYLYGCFSFRASTESPMLSCLKNCIASESVDNCYSSSGLTYPKDTNM